MQGYFIIRRLCPRSPASLPAQKQIFDILFSVALDDCPFGKSHKGPNLVWYHMTYFSRVRVLLIFMVLVVSSNPPLIQREQKFEVEHSRIVVTAKQKRFKVSLVCSTDTTDCSL